MLVSKRLQGFGASLGADARGLRVRARTVGTGRAAGGVASLAARVPAGAIAMLAGPDAGAAVAAAERAGGRATVDSVRTSLTDEASLDIDHDLLARLTGGFTAWVSRGDAAPVIGLAAHTDDPKGLRDALARLQDPVAERWPPTRRRRPPSTRATWPAPTPTRSASRPASPRPTPSLGTPSSSPPTRARSARSSRVAARA